MLNLGQADVDFKPNSRHQLAANDHPQQPLEAEVPTKHISKREASSEAKSLRESNGDRGRRSIWPNSNQWVGNWPEVHREVHWLLVLRKEQ
jgi:hypothetical protein